MTVKKPITPEQRAEAVRRSGPGPYRCPDCGVDKDLYGFGIRRAVPSGGWVRRGVCRECQGRRALEWQKKHPEAIARWQRHWRRRLLKKLGMEGFRAWMRERYRTRVAAVGPDRMREYWREQKRKVRRNER